MVRFFCYVAVLIQLSTAAAASPAVPIKLASDDVPLAMEQNLRPVLDSALAFVRMFPPPGYERNLFNWNAGRKTLRGKSVTLVLATSKTETFAPILRNGGMVSMDAFTMAPVKVDKTMPILVVLLVDKLFYDSRGQELKHGFARLTLALAHEIYGNVQHFLEMDLRHPKPQTMAMRVAQERRAFQASLQFLNNVMSNKTFASLPESVRKGLQATWPSELMAFQSWLKAHPSEKPDPACEAMLQSLEKNSDF